MTPRLCLALTVFASFSSVLIADDPLNADPKVKYIGTENCIECHKDQHQTYLETKHSRSMEKVDVEKEVSPASYHHKLSGNDYEVIRKEDRLVHRETIRGEADAELAVTEHDILYTMGSGTHGKSYIYKSGDFFGQSPLSWFEESKQWMMSPGYDMPFHPGFGRKLSSECFFCHVGSIDRRVGNPNDFSVSELTIGCERCHGPGELHAAKHEKNPPVTGSDNTIVNPSKLSRELSEAVCQQCHLQAAGKAIMANKDEWDYRPGLPLTDFRVDYQYRLGDDTMRIVGHVEQLHMSKCYTQTENLTCITCHNPHETPDPGAIIEHYRAICLNCHEQDSCGVPLTKRESEAKNHCSQCHMPKKDTEVPHTAFHHHRIGIHKNAKTSPEVVVGLTPVLDTKDLTPVERVRCEALAKFQVQQEDPSNKHFRDYGIESAKALIQVKNVGKGDADVNTILAMLALSQGQAKIAKDLATEVVKSEKKPSRARIESLRLLGQLAYRDKDFLTAGKHYREITKYRSEPYDFFQLGICEQNSRDSAKAIEALKTAVKLLPTFVDAHRLLGAILQSKGQKEEGEKHLRLGQQHQARMQRLNAEASKRN